MTLAGLCLVEGLLTLITTPGGYSVSGLGMGFGGFLVGFSLTSSDILAGNETSGWAKFYSARVKRARILERRCRYK